MHTSLKHPRAFSRIDATVLICIVTAVAGILYFLTPSLSNDRRPATYFRNSSQMRGIHQSMVIFAQDNNTYLPGLDNIGVPLASNFLLFSRTYGNTLSGTAMSTRYYILLNGSYIMGDLLINPNESLSKWSNSTSFPATGQFSYSLLRIGDSSNATTFGNQYHRAAEWRDSANSQAILISDRNTASAPTSDKVRSVWSTSPGTAADWKGTVLWGDNHTEFLSATNARLATLSLTTKYGSTINSDDFLFSSDASPGKSATASAMFGYTSQDF